MQNPHVEYHGLVWSPQTLKECATKLIPEFECVHSYLIKIVLCSIWVLSVYSWKLFEKLTLKCMLL